MPEQGHWIELPSSIPPDFIVAFTHDEYTQRRYEYVRREQYDGILEANEGWREENGKLRHLLSQIMPVAFKSNINNWCHVCGYACDVQSGRCKWRESVLEEAEELGIEVE